MASRTRFAGLAVLGLALAPVAVPSAAHSAPAPDTPCLRVGAPIVHPRHAVHDTTPMSPAQVAAVDEQLAGWSATTSTTTSATTSSDTAARTAAAPAVLPTLSVNVQMHIIRGRHKREHRVKWRDAAALFRTLRDGFNGVQSPTTSTPMGVNFRLKRITVTRNDRWYHAFPMSRADRQMRRHLHRGTAQTLNIYIKAFPKMRGGVLLGHSRFPWQYRGHRKYDGVEVNVEAIPGGRARGFNLGDTVIHETGHWFGLLHTFQGGCDPYNDGVKDTPAEAEPALSCNDVTNLCDSTQVLPAPAGPGYYNPAVNFMEYTPDACMRMFTAGQHARAVAEFMRFRHGRR